MIATVPEICAVFFGGGGQWPFYCRLEEGAQEAQKKWKKKRMATHQKKNPVMSQCHLEISVLFFLFLGTLLIKAIKLPPSIVSYSAVCLPRNYPQHLLPPDQQHPLLRHW